MSLGAYADAAALAARAHAGQLRRGGSVPYINHPLTVAAAVLEVTDDPDTACAAVLHDVVEDTDVSLDEIRAAFGPRVAGIVDELTDPPEWDDLSTIERKARQADEYRTASDAARIVKIADQWSNVSDLATTDSETDMGLLTGYLRTSRAVVDICRPAAPELAARFDTAAEQLEAKIEGLRT